MVLEMHGCLLVAVVHAVSAVEVAATVYSDERRTLPFAVVEPGQRTMGENNQGRMGVRPSSPAEAVRGNGSRGPHGAEPTAITRWVPIRRRCGARFHADFPSWKEPWNRGLKQACGRGRRRTIGKGRHHHRQRRISSTTSSTPIVTPSLLDSAG